MAFDRRRTYLCYNNRDLIRDGFILTFIEKEYIPVSSFNISRLKNPPKGVTYIVGRDAETGQITSVREKKKLLSADKIKVEIDFGKVMKNAVSHPISPGALIPGVIGGLVGNLGLGALGFGGITSGLTEITFHILESRTKINQRVEITQEILDTSIIQFDGFPLSIFGIAREHIENFGDNEEDATNYKKDHPQARIGTNGEGDIVARIGLDFSNDQLDVLGKFSEGTFRGTGRKRIDGATDDDGLFGGAANAELRIVENAGDSGFDSSREVVLLGEQNQIFVKIVKDDRKLKFRGDNKEAVGGGVYPFQISGKTGHDVTDRQIRINTTDLVVGDIIYVTLALTVGDRHLRQNIEHKGTIAQGNTIGVIGFQGAIASDQDAFDYRIRTWKVPSLPLGVVMSNVDLATESYDEDDDYKLTLDEFISIDAVQREQPDIDLSILKASEIEGWRLSEAILRARIETFFAADYRGILHFPNRHQSPTILYSRSLIRDQEWFTNYLKSLDFTRPTGPVDPTNPVNENGSPNKTYLPSDLEKKIEDNIDFRDMRGFLFDTEEIVNSLFFDREKTHYYRPFANALKLVSKYNANDITTGIGISHLDLLPLLCSSITTFITTEIIDGEKISRKRYSYSNYLSPQCAQRIDLNYYDLSYGIFDHVNAQPTKIFNCEEPFDIRHYNYFSNNYDTMNEGPGAWYDQGFVNDSIQEWRPDGGTIESYWKIETPYYCSDFSTNSRVYIEKMGGNSLDNYSWVYVDTESFVPSNISADSNFDLRSSMIIFRDGNMHDGLCYHRIYDNFFTGQLPLIKVDKTKTHVRDTYEHTVNGQTVTESYDHDQNLITGQNRILGDTPSYSYGVPISEEIFKVCPSTCSPDSEESDAFWWIFDLLNDLQPDGSSFGLDFSDDVPRVDIPHNWYVRYVEVEFSYDGEEIEDIKKYISFYFEGTESSVSNFKVSNIISKDNSVVFRIYLNYYFGGPFQFLGDFWKEVNIIKVIAKFARGDDESLDPNLNVDTYKIDSGQSAVSYDNKGKILVFYANEDTDNIDVAVSHDDGDSWVYDRNLIRLITGETATMPFVIKDSNSRYVHLFYVLNDAFLMYKRIDTNLVHSVNASVEYEVPESYEAGDYDVSLDDPERTYWGDYTIDGIFLRREPSFFIAGLGTDEYFLNQQKIVEETAVLNEPLVGTDSSEKIQTPRFLFIGNTEEMRDVFKGSPYAVYLSNDGVLRLFITSNGKLSIKRSNDYFTWSYDVFEQAIHKDYMSDELNKGLSEDISNIQIVRNDYDESVVSVLYFHNRMLFIRHFYTNLLTSWYDSDGNLQDQQIRDHLEITDLDKSADPPKERTKHIPIFLVGIIPDSIKNTIKRDIDNEVPLEESDLSIYFPYKDPDNPSDKEANKAMVDIFNENFEVDTNTQVYAVTTATGLIRVFYQDSFGNIDGIIIDYLTNPRLEVMNVFKGV